MYMDNTTTSLLQCCWCVNDNILDAAAYQVIWLRKSLASMYEQASIPEWEKRQMDASILKKMEKVWPTIMGIVYEDDASYVYEGSHVMLAK